jgi:hypothetical protein
MEGGFITAGMIWVAEVLGLPNSFIVFCSILNKFYVLNFMFEYLVVTYGYVVFNSYNLCLICVVSYYFH